MHFSQILTNIMQAKNLSSYRVSKDTGISDSLLGYYRSGKNDPSADNLIKLADYFDVSVDYLLGRTDKPEVNR